MENTITLKVKEERKVEPDLVIVSIQLQFNHKRMDLLLKQARNERGKLMTILQKHNLTAKDIRLEEFHINTNYNAQDHHRFLKSNVIDYQFTQNLNVTFSYEEKKINAILSEIAASKCNITTELTFSVKNKESVIDEVVESLGVSAKRRAEQLLKGTDSCLNELHNVSYEVNFQAYQRATSASCVFKEFTSFLFEEQEEEFLFDTQPSQIRITAEAIYIWYIHKCKPSL